MIKGGKVEYEEIYWFIEMFDWKGNCWLFFIECYRVNYYCIIMIFSEIYILLCIFFVYIVCIIKGIFVDDFYDFIEFRVCFSFINIYYVEV